MGVLVIEELLRQIAERGLQVNNLFQLDAKLWQGNVTDGESVWEFGHGASAEEALQAAFQAALQDQGREEVRKQSVRSEREQGTRSDTSAEEMGL